MSGLTALVDTLLATRLAQRVDLVPLKSELEIAGPGAVTQVEEVTNDVRLPSRAALEQQLGVGLLKSDQRGHGNAAARPGDAVTLSAAARAVSALLDVPAGATAKIIGTAPLLPQSQPPLPHLLSATLARTVANSGLFYESHLAQFAAGTRTLAELTQEPQARLDATVKVALTLPGSGQDSGVSGTGIGRLMEVPGLPGTAAGDAVSIDSGKASRAASLPNSVPGGLACSPDSAQLAHSSDPAHLHKTAYESIQDADGQEPALKNHGASATDAARSNASGLTGIHPDAVPLVRQQLELLAVPVFRWGGEAWPGVPMDWEIHEEGRVDHKEERQAAADNKAVPRTWSTRLALTLPTLRDVEVRISLAGTTLQIHLAARENATRALLSECRAELPKRLEELGLQLAGLQIGSLPAASTAQEMPKDDDAP